MYLESNSCRQSLGIHPNRRRCYTTRASIQRKLQEREGKSTSAGTPEQCGDLAKVAGGKVRFVVQVNLDLFWRFHKHLRVAQGLHGSGVN